VHEYRVVGREVEVGPGEQGIRDEVTATVSLPPAPNLQISQLT
jgi:hypothetical protein